MKPRLIVGIIGIVTFSSVLMFNFSQNLSSYVDFEQASTMSGDNIHVIGDWDDSKPHEFSRETMQFTFYMEDEQGNSRRVVYPRPKPNNFEQADQLVVIGSMQGETFHADDMLVKCPSKYNDPSEAEFTRAEHPDQPMPTELGEDAEKPEYGNNDKPEYDGAEYGDSDERSYDEYEDY